tara:strand:+ start:3020 stop:4240 length:1221 start_codon:yes stop_codon:yes gene_type:complete
MLVKIPINLDFLSESRMSEKRFLNLSTPDKEKYLERYPHSKHKRLMKKAKKAKPEELEAPEAELDEAGESELTTSDKPDQEESEDANQDMDDSEDADFAKDATDVSDEVEKNFPIVRSSIADGFETAQDNIKSLTDRTREALSSNDKDNVRQGFDRVYSGGKLSDKNRAALKKGASIMFKVVLGAAALGAIGAAAGPIGLLVAANYVNSLESFEDKFASRRRKAAEDRKAAAQAEIEAEKLERELANMKSQSAFEDPVSVLANDFLRWFGKINHRDFAEKITELAALKNKPMVSTSGIGVRLTFSLCPTVKYLPKERQGKFLVKAKGVVIGSIDADVKVPNATRNARCWLVTLTDGFVESNYHTGKQKDQPFTAVRSNSVILRNPYRFTLDEAKNWVRSTVKRELL